MSKTAHVLPAMPPCWTDRKNWEEWNRLNVLARDNPGRPLDEHCTDCLPEHKRAMIEAGRCEHPTVKFVRIIERQYDPRKRARREVITLAVKGVR